MINILILTIFQFKIIRLIFFLTKPFPKSVTNIIIFIIMFKFFYFHNINTLLIEILINNSIH